MIRKWLVLLLAAVLLLGCVCPAQATGLLTQKERYDSALQELRKYLNGESAMPLDSVYDILAGVGGAYEQSAAFSLYVRVLRAVEEENYSQVYVWIGRMERNTDFCRYVQENGYGSVAELESYVRGRQAEHTGDTAAAIGYYEQCMSMLDSMWRISLLEDAALEAKYQQAQALYAQETLTGATGAQQLFAELAELGYGDSDDMAQKAAEQAAWLETQEAAARASQTQKAVQATAKPAADNAYTGTAQGFGGDIRVKVTLDGERITGVEVLEHHETPALGGTAIEHLLAELVAANGTADVDNYTGATMTTRGLLDAVDDALLKSGRAGLMTVCIDGLAGLSGEAWQPKGVEMTDEIRAALKPGTVVEIVYSSENGDINLYFPEAANGDWSISVSPVSKYHMLTYISFNDIADLLGTDTSRWGEHLMCEASGQWAVHQVRIIPAEMMEDYGVFLDAMAGMSGEARVYKGVGMTDEFRAALKPGTTLEVSYTSEADDLRIVFPYAQAGWMRISMPRITEFLDRKLAWITYEEIAEKLGDDPLSWGEWFECESSGDWQVNYVRVVPQ